MRIDREKAYAEIAEGVATVYINNPPANALGHQTREDLTELLTALDARDDVRVIILTGAGEKFFTAGADLHEEADLTPEAVPAFQAHFQRLYQALRGGRHPVIAAVNGYAMGGGFELMLNCDFRYGALEAKAAAAGVKVGLVASVDSLPRLLHPAMARELLFTGRTIDGAEAERTGLFNRAVPRAELPAAARAAALEIASRAPLAVQATRRLTYDLPGMAPLEARALSRAEWARLQQTEDHKEALRAFKEKRPPVFRGR